MQDAVGVPGAARYCSVGPTMNAVTPSTRASPSSGRVAAVPIWATPRQRPSAGGEPVPSPKRTRMTTRLVAAASGSSVARAPAAMPVAVAAGAKGTGDTHVPDWPGTRAPYA